MSSLVVMLLESLRYPDQTVRRWSIQPPQFSLKQGMFFWFILHLLWLVPTWYLLPTGTDEALPTDYGWLYIIGTAIGQILIWWVEMYIFWRSLRFFATPCPKWPFLTTIFWQSIAITFVNVFIVWLNYAMVALYGHVLFHEFTGSSADDLFSLVSGVILIYHLVLLYKASRHHTGVTIPGYLGSWFLTGLLLTACAFAVSLLLMLVLAIIGVAFGFVFPFLHWQDFLPW